MRYVILKSSSSIDEGLARVAGRIGRDPVHEISKEEWERITSASSCLDEALSLEKKIDVAIENYVELERELLCQTVRYGVFSLREQDVFMDICDNVGRRVINLLTAWRMYVDQAPRHIGRIDGERSASVDELKDRMRAEYDSNLGYRVLEALRNYVQHYDLPIESLDAASVAIHRGEQVCMEHSLSPTLEIERLARDSDFKRAVLVELQQQSQYGYVALMPYVRMALGGLGRIHDHLRSTLHERISTWEICVQEALRHGTAVAVYADADESAEYLPMSDYPSARRQQLDRKHWQLDQLSNTIFTSLTMQVESADDDDDGAATRIAAAAESS